MPDITRKAVGGIVLNDANYQAGSDCGGDAVDHTLVKGLAKVSLRWLLVKT